MEKKHIVLTGARHVGKSTLIEKLLAHCTVPIYGFFTRSTPRREDGFHSIYLHPAGTSARICTEENHVGDCCYSRRTTNPHVFSRLGVPYLNHDTDGIIAMDELGFMEAEAPDFCSAVLRCLDGEVPVIAVCKDKPGVAFLDQIRNHPNIRLYTVTTENRDALYDTLLPEILRWNEERSG